MDIILWVCLIPILWAVVAYFALPNTITLQEAGVKAGVGCFLVITVYAFMFWSSTADTQILNGYVTGKERNKVSCSHDYKCNCYETCSTDSNGNKSCTEHCSTCYDHAYDIDWDVATTVGNLTIDRISRQGLEQPPRWTAVEIGEPASVERGYTNYLLAAPNSLFNMKLAEQEAKTKAAIIPAYPRVYDYYRVSHVIAVNGAVTPVVRKAWDDAIGNMLRQLAAQKQVNVNVLFIKGVQRDYKGVIERGWVGAKKNDVTILIGVDGDKIQWVEAFTFAKSSGNAMLAVMLRDRIQQVGVVANVPANIDQIKRSITQYYTRKPMEEFKYLADDAGPSAAATGWLIGIILVLLGGATWWFHITDMGSPTIRRVGRGWDNLRTQYRNRYR